MNHVIQTYQRQSQSDLSMASLVFKHGTYLDHDIVGLSHLWEHLISNLDRIPDLVVIKDDLHAKGIRFNAMTNSYYIALFMISFDEHVEQVKEYLKTISRHDIKESVFKLEKQRVLSEIGLFHHGRLKPYLFRKTLSLCFGNDPFEKPIGGIKEDLESTKFQDLVKFDRYIREQVESCFVISRKDMVGNFTMKNGEDWSQCLISPVYRYQKKKGPLRLIEKHPKDNRAGFAVLAGYRFNEITLAEKLIIELLMLHVGGLGNSIFKKIIQRKRVGIYDPICSNRFIPGAGLLVLGGIAQKRECLALIDTVSLTLQELIRNRLSREQLDVLKNNFLLIYKHKDERIQDQHDRFIQYSLYRAEIPLENIDYYLKKITFEYFNQFIADRLNVDNSFQSLFSDGDSEINDYFNKTEWR